MAVFLIFKQKTAYGMRISYWSSDVCSSDLFGLESLGFETLGFEALHLGALGFGALGFDSLGFGTFGFEALGLLRGVAAERGIQRAQVAIGTQVGIGQLGVRVGQVDGLDRLRHCRGIDRKSTRLNSSH